LKFALKTADFLKAKIRKWKKMNNQKTQKKNSKLGTVSQSFLKVFPWMWSQIFDLTSGS